MNKKLRDDRDEKELQRVRHHHRSEITVYMKHWFVLSTFFLLFGGRWFPVGLLSALVLLVGDGYVTFLYSFLFFGTGLLLIMAFILTWHALCIDIWIWLTLLKVLNITDKYILPKVNGVKKQCNCVRNVKQKMSWNYLELIDSVFNTVIALMSCPI